MQSTSPRGLLPAFNPKEQEQEQLDRAMTPPCSSPPAEMSDYENEEDECDMDMAPKIRQAFGGQLPPPQNPTPMPSSSLGNSSPIRVNAEEEVEEEEEIEMVNPRFASLADQGRTFVVRSPLTTVAMVRVPRDGSVVCIGRSSKSCQVALTSKNKLISRVHVANWYDSETKLLNIKCEGYNGIKVSVPYYESEDELDTTHGYPISKGQDEYKIGPGQIIEMEYVPGITVDVMGERALVELPEEDSTDDTEDELAKSSDKENSYLEESPVKPKETTKPKEPLAVLHSEPVQLTPEPVVLEEEKEKEEESVAVEIYNDAPPQPKQKRKLEEVEEETAAAPKQQQRKSAKREEPEHKELSADELENVHTLVSNHLAFSRLAQTPISIIQKSSSALGELPTNQLRSILERIECVGVITRSGKDAAGKPLEDEYFYEIGNDSDPHRVTLAQQMRGGGGLRACRKTHKQYFWKRPALR